MDAQSLADVPLFTDFPPDRLTACAELFNEDRVLMGEHLTDENDFGYSFFIVLDGQVKVVVDGKEVARLGPGEHFGERSLVSGNRRNATVTAIETCRVAKLMAWDFQVLLADYPKLAERLQASAAQRGND